MKRSLLLWLAVILMGTTVSSVAAGQSQNQSLGDFARAVKKTKNPPAAPNGSKVVYDNDNIPRNTSISVVGDTDQPSSDAKKDTKDAKDVDDQDRAKNPDDATKQGEKSGDEKSSEKKDEAQLKSGQSAEERQKALNAWKDKLAAQQDKISLLSRELDVLQREHQLKAAEFYADTARRTQNPNGFNSDDTKFKQQIAEKQKQLDDAKGKLSSLQDEARKSGAPSSITE